MPVDHCCFAVYIFCKKHDVAVHMHCSEASGPLRAINSNANGDSIRMRYTYKEAKSSLTSDLPATQPL